MALWGVAEGEGAVLPALLCVLRVPGLALLDLWWTERAPDSLPESLDVEDVAESGIGLLVLLLALCLLLLPLPELVEVYLHALAAAAVGAAAMVATSWLEEEARREEGGQVEVAAWGGSPVLGLVVEALRRHLCPIASHLTLTSVVAWCLGLSDPLLSRTFPSCYILPVALRVAGAPLAMVAWCSRVTSGFLVLASLVLVASRAGAAFLYLRDTWLVYSLVRELEGAATLLLIVVRRVLEPPVLVVYWVTLVASQLWSNFHQLAERRYVIQEPEPLVHLLVAATEVCESPLVLVATCLVLMLAAGRILSLTRRLLALCGGQVGAGGPVLQAGVTEGVVAFVLALQTGLTDIEMPARIGAFSIILFVVTASLLQSCLDTAQPVLLALPATNRRWWRHAPALALTLGLLALPLAMVHALLTVVSSDLWTLVIISSCLVTAVQAVGALATYALFVWDSGLTSPSPHIDDYVYYVKAATRSSELLLAVAVVCCGFYESVAEGREWSALNTVVLLVHCYFNIYTRIAAGWASYLARRETSRRLGELPEAAPEELAALQDVCAICYQEMVGAAVRTQCRHYFHTHCLRRWLVVQDNCPMCTQPIVARKEQEQEEEEEPVEEGLAEETEDEDVAVEESEEAAEEQGEKEDGGLRRRVGARGEGEVGGGDGGEGVSGERGVEEGVRRGRGLVDLFDGD